MSHEDEELVIADDNDYIEIAGPVTGKSPVSGVRELFHSTDVVAFITSSPTSNTPIGTLSYNSTEIGTSAKYPIAFDGDDVTTSLAALDDGATVYRVVRSPGNWRIVTEVTYRKTRPADT